MLFRSPEPRAVGPRCQRRDQQVQPARPWSWTSADRRAGSTRAPLALDVCGRTSRPCPRAVSPSRLRTDQKARLAQGLPWPSADRQEGPISAPLALAVSGRNSRTGPRDVTTGRLRRTSRPVPRKLGPGRLQTDQQSRPARVALAVCGHTSRPGPVPMAWPSPHGPAGQAHTPLALSWLEPRAVGPCRLRTDQQSRLARRWP